MPESAHIGPECVFRGLKWWPDIMEVIFGVQLVSSFWPVRDSTSLCLTNRIKMTPALEVTHRAGVTVLNCALNWVQGLDLNQRPSGYEPDELPGCSTLQQGAGKIAAGAQSVNGYFAEVR